MSKGLDISTATALVRRSYFIGSFIGRYAY
jgi:hypothetical protein